MRIVLHLERGAFGDLAAEFHRHHVIGDLHHHRHVVLDEQDREIELPTDVGHGVAQLVDFGVRESGRRLVHEKKARSSGEGPGDLESLERAERQTHGRTESDRSKTELVEEIARPITGVAILARRPETQDRPNEPDPSLTVRPDHHVLENGHGRKERQVLEGARDTERGDPVSWHRQQVGTLVPNRTFARLVDTAHHVEHRGLARPVRSDEATDLAAVDRERQTVESHDAPETNGHAIDVEQTIRRAESTFRCAESTFRRCERCGTHEKRTPECHVAGSPPVTHETTISTPVRAEVRPARMWHAGRVNILDDTNSSAETGHDPAGHDTMNDARDVDDVLVLPWWQNPLNFVALGLAALILGIGIGYFVGDRNASPAFNDSDVGFLQDMRYHHEQGVDMAFYYLTEVDDAHPLLRLLAREMLYVQQLEVGRMIEWLRAFGHSEVNDTGTAMAWMGTPVPIDEMDGLASQDELNAFASTDGVDASIQFATLMIEHHQGGLHMAEYVRDAGRNDDVRGFADSMIIGQTGEITELSAVLEELVG